MPKPETQRMTNNPFPPHATFSVDFFAEIGAGLIPICRLEEPPNRDRTDCTFNNWLLHIDLPHPAHTIYRIGKLRPDGLYDADWPD